MASSGRNERVYHQDYIARIRYSNTLPPPPNPPKLLDIPGTGLAGGQYTSAAFASRLAREQPLNIEADAELGMPIDLVGLPGVFDGDERGQHSLFEYIAVIVTDIRQLSCHEILHFRFTLLIALCSNLCLHLGSLAL